MKLLHIDSSILADNSVSRQVTARIVERLQAATPGIETTTLDLGATPLPHLSGAHLAVAFGAVPTSDTAAELATGQAALDDFLAADIVVIGAPMYNFTIPSQLKAWLDRILVAGKTFSYTAEGPVGLAGGKRVIVALSRGGFYGPGMPAAAYEHVETYLRAVFGFIGITDLEFVAAEGIAVSPEQREKALASAFDAVDRLAA